MHRIALLASLLIAACSTPYSTPHVEEPPRFDNANPFDGVVSLLDRNRPLRVFWVHGMCSHGLDWVQKNTELVARALNEAVPAIRRPAAAAGDAYTVPVPFDTPRGRVEVIFFVWSPLTAKYKSELHFDRSGDDPAARFPYKRASLNRDLKHGLVNDCFTDAVAYSGANGNPVRAAALKAVCEAMRGSVLGGECRPGAPAPRETIVLVTESLGSKVVFDAVRQMWEQSRAGNARLALAARLASVQMVFMAANQVPLLDQANPTSGPGVAEFSAILVESQRLAASAAAPSRTIVAFTDPNDLLSYRLTRKHVADGVRLVNVIVSNDTTYFGWVERPDLAHCGYRWNTKVIGALMHGYDGKALRDVAGAPPASTCFAE